MAGEGGAGLELDDVAREGLVYGELEVACGGDDDEFTGARRGVRGIQEHARQFGSGRLTEPGGRVRHRRAPRQKQNELGATSPRASLPKHGVLLSAEDHHVPGGSAPPFFGSPAIRPRPDPWLCVPASRRVCLFREGSPLNLDQLLNECVESSFPLRSFKRDCSAPARSSRTSSATSSYRPPSPLDWQPCER